MKYTINHMGALLNVKEYTNVFLAGMYKTGKRIQASLKLLLCFNSNINT